MTVADGSRQETAIIPINTAVSQAVNVAGYRLSAVIMPAVWTAATLTLLGSHDGTTFQRIYVDDEEWSLTVAAALNVSVPGDKALALQAYKQLKAGSGAAQAVNQAAARSIVVVMVPA